MPERPARRRLDQPASPTRRFRVDVDADAVGRLAERLARFLGTGTYLLWQTVLVIVWIILNVAAVSLSWDPYPFILLNLAFSTQAAYAAPLILLAQNRQDDRDRVALDEDRARATRTIADTEYIARELASLRLAIGEAATRDFLRSELERRTQRGTPPHSSHQQGSHQPGDRPGGLDRDTHDVVRAAVDRAMDRVVVEGVVERSVERVLARATVPATRRTTVGRGAGADGRDHA